LTDRITSHGGRFEAVDIFALPVGDLSTVIKGRRERARKSDV
jgi:hypothetical protein